MDATMDSYDSSSFGKVEKIRGSILKMLYVSLGLFLVYAGIVLLRIALDVYDGGMTSLSFLSDSLYHARMMSVALISFFTFFYVKFHVQGVPMKRRVPLHFILQLLLACVVLPIVYLQVNFWVGGVKSTYYLFEQSFYVGMFVVTCVAAFGAQIVYTYVR